MKQPRPLAVPPPDASSPAHLHYHRHRRGRSGARTWNGGDVRDSPARGRPARPARLALTARRLPLRHDTHRPRPPPSARSQRPLPAGGRRAAAERGGAGRPTAGRSGVVPGQRHRVGPAGRRRGAPGPRWRRSAAGSGGRTPRPAPRFRGPDPAMHFSIPETETRAGDGGDAYVVSGAAAAGPGGGAVRGPRGRRAAPFGPARGWGGGGRERGGPGSRGPAVPASRRAPCGVNALPPRCGARSRPEPPGRRCGPGASFRLCPRLGASEPRCWRTAGG